MQANLTVLYEEREASTSKESVFAYVILRKWSTERMDELVLEYGLEGELNERFTEIGTRPINVKKTVLGDMQESMAIRQAIEIIDKLKDDPGSEFPSLKE
jgi:hypothetical protein